MSIVTTTEFRCDLCPKTTRVDTGDQDLPAGWGRGRPLFVAGRPEELPTQNDLCPGCVGRIQEAWQPRERLRRKSGPSSEKGGDA